MDASFYLIQALNGVQYGLLLFLIASGLTLIFGVMGILNLAHGSFYLLGAYMAYYFAAATGSLIAAILIATPIAILVGILVERITIVPLYGRGHLDQVLLTYGLILIISESARLIWGSDYHGVEAPAFLRGSIPLTENSVYPVYRLFVSGVCLTVAALMYFAIRHTRVGMMIRAGAANREMTQALGVPIRRVFTVVFGVGAGLAALAGSIWAPASSVYPGMGEDVLILSFVVVVVGGLGSIPGALVGAILVGLADAFGKALLPRASGFVIYGVMAAVLVFRPHGLFGGAGR